MPQERKSWEESTDLFRAREDDESPRHDVGGSISGILNESTEQNQAHTIGVLDADEMDEEMAAVSNPVAVEVGLDVMGSCGHKIGEVVDVRPDHLVVEKGFLVPEDVYVPKSAIAKADEHHLTLNVTRTDSEHSGWENDPEGIEDEDVIEDPEDRL